MYTVRKKRYESCHWGGTFSKRYRPRSLLSLLYKYVSSRYQYAPFRYHEGTNMHPIGTKVYLLKRYRPSDSFRTFFF